MAPDVSPLYETKVATVTSLYRALASGDRETLGTLLHPDFVGYATDGLPLGVGGEHAGPEAMRRDVWWTRTPLSGGGAAGRIPPPR